MYISRETCLTLTAVLLIVPQALSLPLPRNLSSIIDTIKNKFSPLSSFLDSISHSLPVDTILNTTIPGSTNPPSPLNPSLFPNLAYFSEYSAAAYCAPLLTSNTKLICPPPFCPTLTRNSVLTKSTFRNRTDPTDTTGFIALDNTTSSIVLSFRGSQTIRNFLTDAVISFTPVPQFCPNCEAHTGFLAAMNSHLPNIITTLTSLLSQNPTFSLVVTGHSLGGAIAALTAIELRRRGLRPTLYTYGSPRVGNKELSKFLTNSGENFRVTHLDDPVPRLPPLVLGYEHSSPEYHIFRGDSGIRAEDVHVLTGTVNFNGNTGVDPLGLNVTAHLHYFLDAVFSGCGDLSGGGRIEFK